MGQIHTRHRGKRWVDSDSDVLVEDKRIDAAEGCELEVFLYPEGKTAQEGIWWEARSMRAFGIVEAEATPAGRGACPLCKGKGTCLSVQAINPDGTVEGAVPAVCMVCDGNGQCPDETGGA